MSENCSATELILISVQGIISPRIVKGRLLSAKTGNEELQIMSFTVDVNKLLSVLSNNDNFPFSQFFIQADEVVLASLLKELKINTN